MVISKQITSEDDEEAPRPMSAAETSILSDEAMMSLQNQSGLTIGLKLSPRRWLRRFKVWLIKMEISLGK